MSFFCNNKAFISIVLVLLMCSLAHADEEREFRGRKCHNGEHACKVDKGVDDLGKEVGGLADSYKDGSIWKTPVPNDGKKRKTKYRLIQYPLMIPTYAMKFATWPAAVLGDYLFRKGVVNKVIDVISSDDRTLWVYPRVELGFGSGFGGGVGIRDLDLFHKNYDLSMYYQIHINMNQEAKVSLEKPDAFYIKDRPFSYRTEIEYFRHHDTSYYGIGIQAPQSWGATFGIDAFRFDNWVGYELIDNLNARFDIGYLWDSTFTGDGNDKSVVNIFPASQLCGYGDSLYYLKFGPRLIHDTRDTDIYPTTGGKRTAYFHRYQGLATSKYDFNEYGLDASQFISLAGLPDNILVLRGAFTYQQQTGKGIPFFYLNRLDMYTPLRGFDYARFNDRGRVIFNVEYRYPIWRFMSGTFFFDTGRVFHEMHDLSFKHFKFAGGGGITLTTKNFYLMRFQLGYGGEGVKVLMKTSHSF